MIRLKIREKSIALFCLCALLPLALVSMTSMISVRDATTGFVTTDLSLATRMALDNLERFFADRVVDLRSWRELRVMQDALIDDREGEISRDLAKLREQYPYFADLTVLNAAGIVVASATPSHLGRDLTSTTPYQVTSAGYSYQSMVATSLLVSRRTLTFAEPIRASYDQWTIIGTLIGSID